MSLEEIRAAAPQVEWRNVMVSPFTGRVFSMRSDDTIPIAGVEFEVAAMAHYYEHELRLEGARRVADAAECERVGLDVLAAIEPQAGPFSSFPPVGTPPSGGGLYWQTQRSANGSVMVVPTPAAGTPGRTDGETLVFGNGSTVLVEAFDGQYRPRPRVKRFGGPPAYLRMSAHHLGDWREVRAEVDYGGSGNTNCAMHVELRTWTLPPLPQAFDTAKAQLTREASMAERHLVHGPVAGQSMPALDVELACDIERRSGWTQRCGVVRPDTISPAQEKVAQDLARLLAYDMSAVDRDDPQPMRGTVRVRVDPAARKPIDFLAAPRTPFADIEFLEQPDQEAARQVAQFMGKEEETVVDVPLACRIEADGSLLCADPQGAADPGRAAVTVTAARVAAQEYRAAPSLRNGGPSAGAVFDFAVRVQPAY
jgi:hypothetical protein